VLNLFGYTGAATTAAALGGAEVCHIDASQSAVNWCRENARLSGLKDAKIRYIAEDCLTFIKREQKRKHYYDAIIMDPPAFGRGKRGEVWKLEDDLWGLLKHCAELFSDAPLFWLINGYASNISPIVLYDMLSLIIHGKIQFGELGLPVSTNKTILPCGIYCRWTP
jgi:23S rRNA (cytosine1962-C5)-methyltransferase